MKYMAVGSAMINDIYYADGGKLLGQLGGGGLYGTFGLRLWDDEVKFTASAGRDFKTYFGPWFARNNLTTAGVREKLEYSTYFKVEYHPDGRYDETPVNGNFADFGYLSVTPEEISRAAGEDTKGIYLIMDTDLVRWEEILTYKKRQGFQIMWEINTNRCIPENRKRIETIAPQVEFFSINLPETKSVFGVQTEEEALQALIGLHTNVLFRVGKKGLYVIMDGQAKFYPTITGEHEVDPTGCGNSSTAAALYAYCEGGDRDMIGTVANVTSAINVQFQGLCQDITPALRDKAKEMVRHYYKLFQA